MSNTTSEQELLVSSDGPVLHIQFNRPQARNALTFAMYRGLAGAIQGLDSSGPIKAVVISGAGDKAFAAGTDIGQFKAFKNAKDAIAYEQSISEILEVLEQSPVPTIAAVSGACTGGGFGIAACCDVRVVSADAKFGLPMARTLGNCLSLSTHARFVSLLGASKVKDLIITARLAGAQELQYNGFVSEICPDAASTLARAKELALSVAGQAPLTMRVTKESVLALRSSIDLKLEEELFLKAYLSQDFQEGVAAFLEKRPAQWSGT